MEYYFVADFGSANSGCAYMEETQKESPYLLHSTGPMNYAKDDTCFAIKKSFLDELIRNFSSVEDSDFRIKSDSNGLCDTKNQNVIWREGALSREEYLGGEYIVFSHFKMHLYQKKDKVIGSNNIGYDVTDIIKIFLRILKIDALTTFQTTAKYKLQPSDIVHWGLTIPAIWSKNGNEEIMTAMRTCANAVFGDDCLLLSEPQGALTFFQFYAITGSSEFKKGRVSVVVDAGGGTTDLACVVEDYVGGEQKYNSVMLPDGVGHAGNEIDRDFWIELADLLVQGSGTEKQYENDDKCAELISKYINSSYCRKREFYKEWRRVQADCYERNSNNLTFRFKKDYLFWLKDNGHKAIVKYLQDEYNEINIDRDVVEKCHLSVIKKYIVPSITKFINEVEKRYKVDRIILAGGLSYTTSFEQEIRTLAREKGINEIATCGTIAKASGAVMFGAVTQLKNPNLITNTAVKSIFYDIKVRENDYVDFCIRRYNERFGLSSLLFSDNKTENIQRLFIQTIQEKIKLESPYRKVSYAGDGTYIDTLSPICVKGCLANDFKDRLIPFQSGQTSISFDFYASDEQICVYSSNPSLHFLKHVDVDLGYCGGFDVEIKFNAGQIGNPIVFTVKDKNGNILKSETFENLFKKGC